MGWEDMLEMAIALFSSYQETASQLGPSPATSLMGLSHLVLSVDAQAWWVAALGARSHPAAGGRKLQGLLL